MPNNVDILNRIQTVLVQLRPYLEEDGGDLELVELTDDFVARIELKGNCTSCHMNNMTFRNGIRESIMRAIPEIKEVEAVNFNLYPDEKTRH